MKFIADENFDFPIIKGLREFGHDVLSVSEKYPFEEDMMILSIAKSENRILLTGDKDFGELVFRLKLAPSGIILLRTPDIDNPEKTALILKCIEHFGEKLLSGFCVVTSRKMRFVEL